MKRDTVRRVCFLAFTVLLFGTLITGPGQSFAVDETQSQETLYIAAFFVNEDFIDTTMAPAGAPIPLLQNPTREELTFVRWLWKDKEVSKDLPEGMPVGGINIYAEFRPRTLERIAVTTPPYAGSSAINGLSFNPDGMVLTLYYDNDTTRTLAVTNAMIENGSVTVNPAWFTQPGQQTLTVTYEAKSATVSVTVVDRSAIGISVAKVPSKAVYLKGETLSLTGGELRVNFDNATQVIVPMTDKSVSVTGFNPERAGEQTLTVTYTDPKGKTHKTSFTVTVNERPQYAKGDVNADGKVNALDLLRLQRHILGIQSLAGANLTAGDVNADGKVNALDLLIIQRHILGIETIKP